MEDLDAPWEALMDKMSAFNIPMPGAFDRLPREEQAEYELRGIYLTQEVKVWAEVLFSGRRIAARDIEYMATRHPIDGERFRGVAALMNEHAELFRARDTPAGKHRRYVQGFQMGAAGHSGAENRGVEHDRGYRDGLRALELASRAYADDVGHVIPPPRRNEPPRKAVVEP